MKWNKESTKLALLPLNSTVNDFVVIEFVLGSMYYLCAFLLMMSFDD